MASSRARSKKTDPLEQQLLDIVRVAVAHAASLSQDAAAKSAEPLKRQPQAPRAANATVALGLSGGRDSMALLDLLARLASTRGTGIRRVIAIHVHHGLSRNADAWLAHCEAECARMGVPLITPPCRSQAAWPRNRGGSARSALRRACRRSARSRRAHRDDGASPRRSSRNVFVAMDAWCGARRPGSISRCSRF